MMEDRDRLIIDYLSGDASDAEARRIDDWIREKPEHAQEFARIALMHGHLRGLVSGEMQARESGANDLALLKSELEQTATAEKQSASPNIASRRKVHSIVYVAAGLAAALLIAVGSYAFRSTEEGPQLAETIDDANRFATILQVSDAVWKSGGLQADDRIGQRTLELESGIVLLRFDSGVEVTLQGPAAYELITESETRLASGLLTATVPPGAEGFQVDTPSAQVIDLGTAFGVEVDQDGVADVLVFDGEVEVVSENSEETRRLTEGESLRLRRDGSIESSGFDTSRFARLWPISSGIVASTGAFRYVPPWPKRLRFVRSDKRIFVARERYSKLLVDPLGLNITEPGVYTLASDLTPGELPTGRRVQSYILHYFPLEDELPRFTSRIRGSITFDRPVLGLIVLHEELVDSIGRFSWRPAGELARRRQLELNGRRDGDVITLSEDRHTVSVNLSSPGQSSDLVRVIVDYE